MRFTFQDVPYKGVNNKAFKHNTVNYKYYAATNTLLNTWVSGNTKL